MSRRRKDARYLGFSRVFHAQTNREFENGWDITFNETGAQAVIRSATNPERQITIQSNSNHDAALFRDVLTAMQQVAFIDRREAGEFAVPKPGASNRRKKVPAPSCPTCGGQGGGWDEEGNWHDCPACVSH